LRDVLDEPAFTTDIIVGFPGETDADFEATCQLVRAIGFSKIHIFAYSPRHGTPATALPDRVAPKIVAHRRERLRLLERELADTYYRRLIGRHLDVLVEGGAPPRAGFVQGTSCRFAPVAFAAPPGLLGQRRSVHIEAVANGILWGTSAPYRVPLSLTES
jgi:threonylcarbamoyladenosine tRNA methylthiotransferase MtaB